MVGAGGRGGRETSITEHFSSFEFLNHLNGSNTKINKEEASGRRKVVPDGSLDIQEGRG